MGTCKAFPLCRGYGLWVMGYARESILIIWLDRGKEMIGYTKVIVIYFLLVTRRHVSQSHTNSCRLHIVSNPFCNRLVIKTEPHPFYFLHNSGVDPIRQTECCDVPHLISLHLLCVCHFIFPFLQAAIER